MAGESTVVLNLDNGVREQFELSISVISRLLHRSTHFTNSDTDGPYTTVDGSSYFAADAVQLCIFTHAFSLNRRA